MRRHLGIAALALVLVGCGSSTDARTGTTPPPAPPTSAGAPQAQPTGPVEQDPTALRGEMNTLSQGAHWHHDLEDVNIEGQTVIVRVAVHDDHVPPTTEDFMTICEKAYTAATKAGVNFATVSVVTKDKPLAARAKAEPACHA